ncbi:enoyl-CoA hydratase/isomerase family protein [Marinobacter caseinilyticus]|uniref:enoyl-CoA hydratase/isomerase family protein n=1 Tax=Marinobacter caseinilyticus TaxID=2692195 RepID=UPI001408465A|nr:enoyl-CoA hydratase/isomerase family protein [Marinobacter caseinilyticus]
MPIHCEERLCVEGHIGVLTLDAPDTLNALSSQMIDEAQAALDRWAEDSRISLVMIQGQGDKAFCAGGDIQALYSVLQSPDAAANACHYFSNEYRLNFTLHRFPKPVIGWANGVVMGGGLGLLAACRYRLVTPDLIMAMPEISIGLFPDVGASWFLNRLPEGLGLFMGLTGARLNATDALRVGLADMAVYPHHRDSLLDQIQSQRWSGEAATDDNRLYRLLNQLDSPPYPSLPESQLARHEQTIARLCQDGDLPDIVDRLLSEPATSDWWHACIETLRGGCPTSAWLVQAQLKHARQLSLKDIFRMELVMATRCAERPDFAEGIRARLIDRDHAPQWSYSTIRAVPSEVVEQHFVPPWHEQDDPLTLD